MIAGGHWQIPIVSKAKQMGCYVINSNLYADSPAFAYADVGLICNVLDKEKNLAFAKAEQVDAVVTDQSDIAVPTVAYVCEQLGLPSIGRQAAERFTNKHVMREYCQRLGFPTPEFTLCRSKSEAHAFAAKVGYPFVLKPPSNQASRGVTKITSNDQIDDAFDIARHYSADSIVLAEGFIPGVELTVDGIKTSDKHYCLATSYKTHYKHNPMVAKQLFFANKHPEIDFKQLHEQHNDLIRHLDLPFGQTHAEYKFYNGNFYLIEVAARGGGTLLSSHIVPLMSGVDANQMLIRMALGESIKMIVPDPASRVTVMEFLEFEPGEIAYIEGVDDASVLEGVISVQLNIEAGSVIKPASDDSQRHGHIIASAQTASQLDALLHAIKSTIRIHYTH